MKELELFALGSQRTRWLSAKAAVVATNVANADTPGYKPRDVLPFRELLASEERRSIDGRPAGEAIVERPAGPRKHSGNGVSLELEMAELGDARGQQALVTGIVGAFHRMLLSSSKG